MTWSQAIKAYRTAHRMSQQGLAMRLRLAVGTVVQWERGTVKPSPMAREKLATLGISLEEKPVESS